MAQAIKPQSLLDILPPNVQLALLDFAARQVTGQISLNFNQGRVESVDIREHERIRHSGSLACTVCRCEIQAGDRGWAVRNREPYCSNCR